MTKKEYDLIYTSGPAIPDFFNCTFKSLFKEKINYDLSCNAWSNKMAIKVDDSDVSYICSPFLW